MDDARQPAVTIRIHICADGKSVMALTSSRIDAAGVRRALDSVAREFPPGAYVAAATLTPDAPDADFTSDVVGTGGVMWFAERQPPETLRALQGAMATALAELGHEIVVA